MHSGPVAVYDRPAGQYAGLETGREVRRANFVTIPSGALAARGDRISW